MSTCKVLLAATVPMTARLFLRDQAIFFAERGMDVSIVTSGGPDFDALEQDLRTQSQVSLHRLDMERQPSPLADLRAIIAWFRLLRSLKPDLTVAGTPKAALLATLASFLVRIPARVYFVHGFRSDGMTGFSKRLTLAGEWITCHLATHIVCVSNGVKARMEEAGVVDPGDAVVLEFGSARGIDVTSFAPVTSERRNLARSRLGITDDPLVVGFAGRLTRDKGLGELFRAVEQLRQSVGEIILLVAGASDDSDPLTESDAQLMESTWIHQLGRVAEMESFYHSLDVFCLPSYREGLPTVNLEAGAFGIPVVTTFATGCAESIYADESGLLVPVGDVQALADALNRIVSSPSLGRSMGMRGRRWVEQRFDQTRVLGAQYRFLAHFCQPWRDKDA